MDSSDLLTDGFVRIQSAVTSVLEGLTPEQAAHRLDREANPIAWLVWHLTRVQDDHVSELAGREQEWITGEWNLRFGTSPEPSNTGYGHTSEQVAEVVPDSVATLGLYHDAVFACTRDYLAGIDEIELEQIIDRS